MTQRRTVDPRQIEVMDEAMVQVLRAKTGAERLEIAFGMFSSARRMLTKHLSDRHPDWPSEKVAEAVARRLAHGDP